MKIANLRFEEGYWKATVSAPDPPNGHTYEVDTKYGSWQVVPATPEEPRRFVLAAAAAQLQREVHKLERKGEGVTNE